MVKVFLKPLQKMKQLENFRVSNCVFCGSENGMFTMTFQLNHDSTRKVLQDVSIIFKGEKSPGVYLSEPYTYKNVKGEVQV